MNRDPYFDNMKFLLIVLVVVGHALEPVTNSFAAVNLVYLVIYSFHMPVFTFISGYFAKDITQDNSGYKAIAKYLLLYLLFESAYIILFYGNPLLIIAPLDHMWYLLSLVMWFLLLPFFSRHRYLIVIAVGIYILVSLTGLTSGNAVFSLSRTIAFFPFFLAGYHVRKSGFALPSANKYISAAMMLLISAVIYYIYCGNEHYGAWLRLFTFAVSVIMSYCFMSLIPPRNTFFTAFGGRTLQVYLLHWPVIKIIENVGYYEQITSPFTAVPIVVAAVLLSFILSFKLIEQISLLVLKMHSQSPAPQQPPETHAPFVSSTRR